MSVWRVTSQHVPMCCHVIPCTDIISAATAGPEKYTERTLCLCFLLAPAIKDKIQIRSAGGTSQACSGTRGPLFNTDDRKQPVDIYHHPRKSEQNKYTNKIWLSVGQKCQPLLKDVLSYLCTVLPKDASPRGRSGLGHLLLGPHG